jgi:hypothetical protein
MTRPLQPNAAGRTVHEVVLSEVSRCQITGTPPKWGLAHQKGADPTQVKHGKLHL